MRTSKNRFGSVLAPLSHLTDLFSSLARQANRGLIQFPTRRACHQFLFVLYEPRGFMDQSMQKRVSPRKRRLFDSFSFSLGIRLRLASLLVFLSVFFAFGARLSHMLLVQHAICEHGHLVDEHRPETKLQKIRGADPIAQDADRDANNTDEHDHCDVLSVWHHNKDVSIIPHLETLSWIEPLGLRKASQSQPIDIIALAPKSSPPNASAV
jgi:hypothetical protein